MQRRSWEHRALHPRMDSEESQASGRRKEKEEFTGLVLIFYRLCSQYTNALPLKYMGVYFEDL